MKIVKTTLWTRILSLLLVGAMLLPCLTGCAESGMGQTDNPTEAQTTTTQNVEDPSETDPTTEPPVIEPPVQEPVSKDVTLSVWTNAEDQGEGSWLENRLEAFKAAYPEYNWTFELGACGEGDAGNVIMADPSAAGDVFMYGNDQLGVLYQTGALARLGGDYLKLVQESYSSTLVNTVTYTDGGVYGFPMANNTWFMYYNKDTYTAEDIKTMDGLLAKGTVAMQMGNAWYTAGFFMANGCTLFGPSGIDAAAGIQFGGQAGYEAAEAMVKVASHENFFDDINGSGVICMIEGSVDAMFSGSWDYAYLHEYMGDKLGVAALPTITMGGKQVQLRAFAGSKAIGVNPHCENQKEAMMLAAFLSSEESQLERFEMRGIIPAHKNLANNATVTTSEVAAAELAVMNNCSTMQPYIDEMSAFWAPMSNFGEAVMNGDITLGNYKNYVDLLIGEINAQGL
ncbi:MAG: extracellular solute-binding protein [Oscillospiraceae bacterium]|nr:extracellular solute-binding protein [Oscillospiraceae bacterium]